MNDRDRQVPGGEPPTPFHQMLDLRWDVGPPEGTVAVEMDLQDELRDEGGSLEGSVVAALVAIAGTSAVGRVARDMAIETLSITFLAAGHAGPIRASAVPLRIGLHEAMSEVKVVDLGLESSLLAVGLVTVRLLDDEPQPGR